MRSRFDETERKELVDLAKDTIFTSEGKEALDYLYNQRELDKHTLSHYEIGYVPLWVKHEMRGRIIFPIRNVHGNLVSLSSRDWRHLDKERGFWHESFIKEYHLYGMNLNKKEILNKKSAIIVEGEIDAMTLFKNGFTNVVALLGSSFHIHQVALIARYCNEIYLTFDHDKAGHESMSKTIKMYKDKCINMFGIKFIPVFLSKSDFNIKENKIDPDLYLKKYGRESFSKLLEKSKEDSVLSIINIGNK